MLPELCGYPLLTQWAPLRPQCVREEHTVMPWLHCQWCSLSNTDLKTSKHTQPTACSGSPPTWPKDLSNSIILNLSPPTAKAALPLYPVLGNGAIFFSRCQARNLGVNLGSSVTSQALLLHSSLINSASLKTSPCIPSSLILAETTGSFQWAPYQSPCPVMPSCPLATPALSPAHPSRPTGPTEITLDALVVSKS